QVRGGARWAPPRSRLEGKRMRPLALVLLAAVWSAPPAAAQGSGSPDDRARAAEAAREAARAAQFRFEQERLRWLPRAGSWGGGPCDEVLGRMCLRHDE